MIALASSIVALVVGPALLATGRGGARAASAVDAFVVVVVVGVVFLHYVPHALLEAGPIVLVGMLLGLCLPYWAERASRVHNTWVKPLALSAFALHASLDGAAMAGASAQVGGAAFALALVVHRVAEGLAIQHLTRSAGRRATTAALLCIALATVLGFVLGERVLSMGESQTFLFVQTLSSGALLHVVVHGHTGASASPRVEAVGALVGLLVMAGLLLVDPELSENVRELSMGETVFALALHLAPALLAGTLLTACLERYVRPWLMRHSDRHGRIYALGLGLVLAPCACEDERVPVSSRAVLTSATVHPSTLLVSAVLLGPAFAALRFLFGLVCALLLPLPVGAATLPEVPRSLSAGFAAALRSSLGFLLAGLLLGAWLEPVLGPMALARWPAVLTIPAAASLGLLLHACAIGVTPLLVVLAHKQLDVGALLALALATALARAALLQKGFTRALWMAFALSAASGFVAQSMLGEASVLDLHAHADAELNWFEVGCLALCLALLLRVLVREGPRAVFAPLWPSAHPHHAH